MKEAEKRARSLNLSRFEAWTRDNAWTQKWYEKVSFQKTGSYYHV